MISLLIDTSNKPLSIAINKDSVLMAEINVNIKKTHSETLMKYIADLLNYADINKTQIGRIIVAKGPGSYTGVRIGVTVAKTLAYSLKCDLYSVSSLFVLAASSRINGAVAPVFDARRGNVFGAYYVFGAHSFEEVMPPAHISYNNFKQQINNASVIGDITDKLNEEIKGVNHITPRIAEVEKYEGALTKEDPYHMVPEYLRISEAERNWIEKNQSSSGK